MLSQQLAVLLKQARNQLDMSREELAWRAGVSVRLVAELERGQRQNVSLETALKLLGEVGISITARAPSGEVAEVQGAGSEERERLARAAYRRKNWTGSVASLHQDDQDPQPPRSASQRFAAVSELSRHAYAIAAMNRVDSPAVEKTARPTPAARRQVGRKSAVASPSRRTRTG